MSKKESPDGLLVKCNTAGPKGNPLFIAARGIVAAEEVDTMTMRVYCQGGHKFDISDEDYDKILDVLRKLCVDYRIV